MRKVRLFVVVLIALLLMAIAGTIYYLAILQWHTEAYAAGRSNTVKVYRIDNPAGSDDGSASDAEKVDADAGTADTQTLTEAGTLVRGTQVDRYRKAIHEGDETYVVIRTKDPAAITPAAVTEESDKKADKGKDKEKENDEDTDSDKETAEQEKAESEAGSEAEAEAPDLSDVELYMNADDLAEDFGDCVRETEVYVRTPATIYESDDGPGIASFAAKGTCLKVTGFDKLLENGYINKYRVEYQEKGKDPAEGYVYGKYMVATQEEADAVYNEHGEYDAAKEDGFRFELYGGDAKNLDYFPYEKTQIEGNEFCSYARTMYLNGEAAVHPDTFIKIIKETDCNAVVMDLKDGYLAYQSEVAKELSPTSYKSAYATIEDYKESADKIRETGVYMIGRIVVFNDPQYAADHPKDCIKYNGSASWPSGFSRNVWEYNVRLAQEAVKEFGFNEIQFDYVRFPEATYNMSLSGNADFRNKYKEEKAQAIQNFCFYAADQLREVGAYTSVDVFGESAYSYVTAYGQYWTSIANIVDAISAMPYTDHFAGEKPWERPYDSVLNWAKRAAKQQNRLQNPAAARTWITGYNTPYWEPTVTYGYKELMDQIKALEKAGLKGGFIPWNALSDSNKYRNFEKIWNEQ